MFNKTDADLLRMHAEGDGHAFGVLYQRHRPRLSAIAARIAGEDADDALHEGMISAWRHAHRFRGDSAVTTWLHTIVTNAALDYVRRRTSAPEPLADEQTYSGCAERADTRMDIRRQWHRTSPEHKGALLLVDVMGYPVAEAAEILGVSVGALKSRLVRGRAGLAGRLAHLAHQPLPDAV